MSYLYDFMRERAETPEPYAYAISARENSLPVGGSSLIDPPIPSHLAFTEYLEHLVSNMVKLRDCICSSNSFINYPVKKMIGMFTLSVH
ncbi:hypothetical protein ACTXT7_010007 [Hymenolepis weldensis]